MAILEWSPALALKVPAMDATHQEFVALLVAVEAAVDEQLEALWHALIAHTQHHFDQEDRWMQSTGFAAGSCHATQHQVVLEIMREGALHCAQGDHSMVHGMLPELASWFSYHAQTMDAALAQHMQALGFDTETGHMAHAQHLPAVPITGCGGVCSTPHAPKRPTPGQAGPGRPLPTMQKLEYAAL